MAVRFTIKVVFKIFKAGKTHFISITVSETESQKPIKIYLRAEEKDFHCFNQAGISVKTVTFSFENVRASRRKHFGY